MEDNLSVRFALLSAGLAFVLEHHQMKKSFLIKRKWYKTDIFVHCKLYFMEKLLIKQFKHKHILIHA